MKLVLAVVLAFVFVGEGKISDLGWMSGCWIKEGRDKESFVKETWGKPHGMMLGFGQTVRNGKTSGFENLRIEKRDGKIYYVARPSGADSETSFQLTSYKKNSAVFENPEHDFPKMISYQREGEVLKARVSAGDKGFDLIFKKVSCAD